MRDMRDALGALGPVNGQNPELNNLTVAMTIVEQGDIVFLTSDGVSDNFDPVVGKFAVVRKKSTAGTEILKPTVDAVKKMTDSKQQQLNNKNSSKSSQATKNPIKNLRRSMSNPDRDAARKIVPPAAAQPTTKLNTLPFVSAEQRHELTLLRMEDVLTHGLDGNVSKSSCTSARKLCELLIEFASKLTVGKRRVLEDPELYVDDNDFNQAEQRRRRRRVGDKLAMMPGKCRAGLIAWRCI